MILFFLASFLLTALGAFVVRKIALKTRVVDIPDGGRKRQAGPVPLLGGIAIWLGFWLPVGYLLLIKSQFGIERIATSLTAMALVSLLILGVGIADDIKPVSAVARFIYVAASLGLLIWFGLRIERVTNPWGGFFIIPSVLGAILVWGWLMSVTYTVKILDGLDGLATGIVGIGALAIFFLTSSASYAQPNVAAVALILAGACGGFLLFNFHPARLYLGESGSLLLGFLIGGLAILGGGKFAIALLVLFVPALDLFRVALGRFKSRQPLWRGDRRHLHFVLRDAGVSEPKVVILFYAVAALSGGLGLLLQSSGKIILLIVLGLLMLLLAGWLARRERALSI